MVGHCNRSGDYSVKWGYKIECDATLQVNLYKAESSSFKEIRWKDIWKTQAPSKIKNVIWHAYKNVFAIQNNLFKRRDAFSVECQICRNGVKSIKHAIFFYNHARMVWFCSQLGYLLEEIGFTSFQQWWSEELASSSLEHFELFVRICTWEIWKSKNSFLMDGASAGVEEFLLACLH